MRHLRNLALYLLSLLPLMAGAADGIVIVVNQAAGIETLSRTDVINIFMGRFRQLPSGATAQPIDMPVSPVRAQFYRVLVNKEPAEINAYWLVWCSLAGRPRQFKPKRLTKFSRSFTLTPEELRTWSAAA
jgi:hypothetical protein